MGTQRKNPPNFAKENWKEISKTNSGLKRNFFHVDYGEEKAFKHKEI